MDAGGLAQMTTSNNFASPNGLPMPSGGLASRRGGQNIKPLSFDNVKQASNPTENGAITPRTSRSHMLAGLRTAPKSATAATFNLTSPTSSAPNQPFARNSIASNLHSNAQEAMYNAPKTAFPQYGGQQQQQQQQQQAQQAQAQQQQQQNMHQHFTVDQVLAPPEISLDEQAQEMDPNYYAQLLATNMFLAQQQQQLQQQLRNVQAAAQQFQHLNLNNPQITQQQIAIYEQQQQLRNMQQRLQVQAAMGQGQQVYYNPLTGQYYFDNNMAGLQQTQSPYAEQPMSPIFPGQQQQQYHQQVQQPGAPRVQVSPPPENQPIGFRSNSPPKRYESPSEVAPLPPPSANAFRRGHKKATSLAPINSDLPASATNSDFPKSAGPKSTTFGPGQARAGEHPIRQPRGPPSLDELKAKPTAKFEGSKNFAARTRRSAVHNLVRAGLVRRKGTGSSHGSMSPVSETAEEATSPVTDNESDSGRSGSGSLAGEMESSSSRTSASGSWGAIGSDRPSSRQKTRKSMESIGSATSSCESENSSFANVFKNGALRANKAQEPSDSQRKAPRLVLTSVEKRKTTPII
jgi:hypothetical protein